MAQALEQLFPGDEAVLLDGAMGTALQALGWPATEPCVLANLQAPELVARVHAGHRRAGARLLLTNTFGALPGIADDPQRRLLAVAAGVHLARTAAAGAARVAGALDACDLALRGPRLADVVRALADGGVDLLVFETCNAARDAEAALQVREACAPHLPLVVCASTTDGGREDRQRVAEVLALLQAAGPGTVEPGLNCCRGPHELLKLAHAQPVPPRWLKPSLGLPGDRVDDQVMAAFARAARLRGARWVGACCGSDEATVALLGAGLRGAVR